MNNSFYSINRKFLKLNGICIHSKELKKQLLSHGSYPSLKSLTDTLSDFRIEYRALKLNEKQLQEYGTPVLLHYNYKGKAPQFVIATHITEDEITFYKDNLRKETKSIDDFSKYWNGVALYVFGPEKQSFVCRISEAFIKYRGFLGGLLTAILFSLALSVHLADSWFYGMLLLKLIGLFFSILLLRHDLGIHSNAERHLCSLSKEVSCDAVLSSAASKLFGMIKMSDIGIVYFSSGLITLVAALLLNETKPVETIWRLFSLCSFPYILFSLSYQKFKVKKWCPLCLGVISTLLIEIVFSLMLFSRSGMVKPSLFCIISLCTFIIWLALLWERLHGYVKSAMRADENEIRFLALKRNASVFNSMLSRQPMLDMMFSEYDIMLGKPEASSIITIAINPFCLPCLEMYEQLSDLLKKHPDLFRLNIRFMSMDEEARNEPVGLMLMSAYFQNKEYFIEMFDFWKLDRTFSSFMVHYGNASISDFARETLKHHILWREKHGIISTPMIFVNNRRLPEIYTESDLLYFLQHKN